MKVIHLSLSARGGAGIAAGRSVRALREQGVEAEFWTADGSELGPGVRNRRWTLIRILLDGMPVEFYRRKKLFSAWSNNWQPSRLAKKINQAKPDIIHLHWVGGAFLSLRELTHLRAPIVWTLHDAWAFTGGCHYPDKCERYAAECGKCPQLGSNSRQDLSWRNLRAKRASLGHVAAFVTPSAWLAGLAAKGGAVGSERVHVVPNGLDGTVFSPANQMDARSALGLPENALVLIGGAHDLTELRKGCHLLRDTMRRVVAGISRCCVLVMFGARSEAFAGDWPCEVRWLGTLREESAVARVCSAADILLMPSLQDNFPNLALEAQACGCPVVGFDTGGLREIIEPMRTGHLAKETTAAALAAAVCTWLAATPDRAKVAERARARFEREFSLTRHGQRMTGLYAALRRNQDQR